MDTNLSESIEKIKEPKPNPVFADQTLRTFFKAIENGDKYKCRRLLEANFYLENSTYNGVSPIIHAVTKGLSEMVILLARYGSKLNTTNKYGLNLLHLCPINNDATMAHTLLTLLDGKKLLSDSQLHLPLSSQ